MKTVIRYRPLIVLAVACAMPCAAHAVTRTYADVPGPVVRGLYATLRALRVHASAARTVLHTPGGFVKSKLVVDACTGAAPATWSCTARLTTAFRYMGSTSARGVAGRPSTRVVGESLLVSFDAGRGALSIALEADDPDTLAISTRYRIAATSPGPAAAAFAADLGVPVADVWRVGVRVEGDETGIRIALDDLPGWIDVGDFSLDQAPSDEAVLSIPVRWYGESTVDYDDTVGADAAICAGTSTHTAVARVAAVDFRGEPIGSATEATAEFCAASAAPLVTFRYTAHNPFVAEASPDGVAAGVGQEAVVAIHVLPGAGARCTARYESSFSSIFEWRLDGGPAASYALPRHRIVGRRPHPRLETRYRCDD